MRVLIDGHMLGTGEGGNERYIESLASALFDHKSIETKVFAPKNFVRQVDSSQRKSFVEQGLKSDLVRILYSLPKIAAIHKSDIIHSTYVGPITSSAKLVITVHDFAFKRFPEFFSVRERLIFNYLLPISMRKAAAIIVPSQFTKEEILLFYPQLAKKVFVTYEAASQVFRAIDKGKARRQVKKKLRIDSPFVLAFNGRIAKKNINRLIDGFNQIASDFPNLQLVVIGGHFNIQKPADELNGVRFLERVSDKDLLLLYNAAEIVVYYSVYEGFGLPILEAFRCKTPVVVSDIAVHREIAGDAAVYANPYVSEDLSGKIAGFLKGRNLREKVVQKGFELTSKYTWRKTAKETFKVYKFALEN